MHAHPMVKQSSALTAQKNKLISQQNNLDENKANIVAQRAKNMIGKQNYFEGLK